MTSHLQTISNHVDEIIGHSDYFSFFITNYNNDDEDNYVIFDHITMTNHDKKKRKEKERKPHSYVFP